MSYEDATAAEVQCYQMQTCNTEDARVNQSQGAAAEQVVSKLQKAQVKQACDARKVQGIGCRVRGASSSAAGSGDRECGGQKIQTSTTRQQVRHLRRRAKDTSQMHDTGIRPRGGGHLLGEISIGSNAHDHQVLCCKLHCKRVL